MLLVINERKRRFARGRVRKQETRNPKHADDNHPYFKAFHEEKFCKQHFIVYCVVFLQDRRCETNPEIQPKRISQKRLPVSYSKLLFLFLFVEYDCAY